MPLCQSDLPSSPPARPAEARLEPREPPVQRWAFFSCHGFTLDSDWWRGPRSALAARWPPGHSSNCQPLSGCGPRACLSCPRHLEAPGAFLQAAVAPGVNRPGLQEAPRTATLLMEVAVQKLAPTALGAWGPQGPHVWLWRIRVPWEPY